MLRRALTAVVSAAVLLCVSQALAQSDPGLYNGLVPTAAQWNGYFDAKLDYNSPGILNGSVDNSPIGSLTPAAGAFTTLSASGLSAGTGSFVCVGSSVFAKASGSCVTNAVAQTVVASPTAPASTSAYAMQGLAGAITPSKTGVVLVTISGTVVAPTGTTVNNGILYQISYGTGSAPANAGTLAGTQVGAVGQYTSAVAPTAAADVHVPFSTSVVVTGLTVGTAYWIDLAAKSVTTASQMGLSAVSISIIEL